MARLPFLPPAGANAPEPTATIPQGLVLNLVKTHCECIIKLLQFTGMSLPPGAGLQIAGQRIEVLVREKLIVPPGGG